ncbi:carboxypeptidase regulatory-like domain-containing protein [Pseudacidobacterium ailaaui]|uniref:carboxypeptidase regulatory-like domain-containing protein n=1 Tax=Pseudacidobacterium ailaaui TaxID=1382359 RepID=UPI001EE29D0E|nr:carboxypeptidase regulatory-like domain-containing protein [Pseudacidobacterium ailaaui]
MIPGIRFHKFAFILLIPLLLTPLYPAFAQLDTGSLDGTVTDSSGSVIANAAVTLTEQNAGTKYQGRTSSTGYYVFPSVRPGTYTLTVAYSGFRDFQKSGIRVYIGTRFSQNVTMQAGAATETVQVTANGPGLETSTSDIGTVITSEQVEELPLAVSGALRSLQTLEFLTPGAVGPGTSGGTTYAKIDGGQTLGSDYLLDGISTQRSENGSGLFDQTTPSVESVQEFRVETTSLPAEFGRTTGGLANFKTRSGTNSYHGVIYDFYKNAALDANSWFNNGYLALNAGNPSVQSQFKRPPDTKNDYGITMGGPVRIPHLYDGRDKTFFFFSFEELRYNNGGTALSTVPTAAERNGDFSATLGGPVAGNPVNPCTGRVLLTGQIFDPNTTQTVNGVMCRTEFQNNQVPTNRSQLAQKILAYIPPPNLPGQINNFAYFTTSTNTQSVYGIRIDQNIGTRHRLFGFWNSRENYTPGNPNFPFPIDTGPQVQDFYAKYFRGGWDYILSPSILNEFVIGSNRINSYNSSRAALSGKDWDQMLGIQNGYGPTFPVFSLGQDGPTIGQANADDNVDNAIAAYDYVNWQKGAHSIRFGGTFRWQQFSYINNGGQAGSFNFFRNQTAGTNNEIGPTGNSVAAFLLGVPGDENRQIFYHHPRWISHYYGAFLQDDWKFRPNLTFNLGFRWDVDTPRWEAEGNSSALNPTAPNPGANGIPGVLEFAGKGAGRNGNMQETWADVYRKDFSPRIGFAWSPGFLQGLSVLRGNYSIYYGPLIYADYGQGLTQGFTANPNYFNANGFLPWGPLDNGFPTPPSGINLDPTQLNGQAIDYVGKSYGRPAMVQSWSLEVQQEIAKDLVGTIGYLGQHSTRLHALLIYLNDMPEKYLQLGDTLNATINSPQAIAAGISAPYPNFTNTWGPDVTVQQALRPFPQYGYINGDSYLQNTGQATYNALEAKLQRRFSQGLTLLASYTFSKTITDADSIQPYWNTLLSQGGTQNPYNLKAEKAVSAQDVPNNFVVSYLYDLPFGKGRKFLANAHPVVNQILGGWRIGGIQRYVTGQPMSFYGAIGIPGFDNGIRFNRVPGVSVYSDVARNHKFNPFNYTGPCNGTGYFNCAAFADPNANRNGGPYHFGTMPRNSADIRTFNYADEDMNLNKTWQVHEQVGIDLRLEAFNVFNRHVFAKPDTNPYDPSFGQILNQFNTGQLVLGPRNMQVVLRIHY